MKDGVLLVWYRARMTDAIRPWLGRAKEGGG